MNILYRLKNVFVKNPLCCQPKYCRKNCPEDYARPNKCRDCDSPPNAAFAIARMYARKATVQICINKITVKMQAVQYKALRSPYDQEAQGKYMVQVFLYEELIEDLEKFKDQITEDL